MEEVVKIKKYYLVDNCRYFYYDHQKWYIRKDVENLVKYKHIAPQYQRKFILTDNNGIDQEFICLIAMAINIPCTQTSSPHDSEIDDEIQEDSEIQEIDEIIPTASAGTIVPRANLPQHLSFYFEQFMDKQEEIIDKITDEKRSKISLEKKKEIEVLSYLNDHKDKEIDILNQSLKEKDNIIQLHTAEFCNAYRELEDKFNDQIIIIRQELGDKIDQIAETQNQILLSLERLHKSRAL